MNLNNFSVNISIALAYGSLLWLDKFRCGYISKQGPNQVNYIMSLSSLRTIPMFGLRSPVDTISSLTTFECKRHVTAKCR